MQFVPNSTKKVFNLIQIRCQKGINVAQMFSWDLTAFYI